jgi:hypothetical protein
MEGRQMGMLLGPKKKKFLSFKKTQLKRCFFYICFYGGLKIIWSLHIIKKI